MRILYLCADQGIPILGNKGGSVHVREMARAFHELGHEVIVLTPHAGFGGRNRLDGELVEVRLGMLEEEVLVRAREEAGDPGTDNGQHKEIRALLRNRHFSDRIKALHEGGEVDFIYERHSLWNFSGLEASRDLNVPFVLEVNAPLAEEQEKYRLLTLKSLARSMEEVLFRGADAIVAVSDGVREYALGKGTLPAKVHVIPNAVDTDLFAPRKSESKETLRREFHLPEGKFLVGFSGSLKNWHGIEVLIDAMRILRSISSDFHLLIVGTGPLRPWVEKAAREEGFGQGITITGEVPHDEIPRWIGTVDIAVAPYLEIPQFYFSPLKLSEYMAMAKPVVASRLGQLEEMIEDGESGILCAPGNSRDLAEKIEFLRSHPAIMRRIGDGARKRVLERGSWKQNAREILRIVEEICTEKRQETVIQGSHIS